MMHAIQRGRAHDLLRARGIERALFSTPWSVTWLTGFAAPVPSGPNLFLAGPPLVWYAGGEWTMIVLDAHAAAAERSGCAVHSYRGYTLHEPIASQRGLFAAVQQVAAAARGVVGVEPHSLPLFLRAALPAAAEPRAIDGLLVPARMIKTDEELALLRANFALTDVGLAAARRAVVPGASELDVWAALEHAITLAAGQRVAIGNDCTVGRRAHQGGWPQPVTIREDDSFVVDLSTQLGGYWSDSCATYYAGTPSPRQAALHRLVSDALEHAIALVRPGVSTGDLDRAVRQYLRDAGEGDYPHHTGHGVGVSGHEEPRIVPYATVTLEAGMVIMLEPGVYLPGETGIRLEHGMLVTDTGAEVLTNHVTRWDAL